MSAPEADVTADENDTAREWTVSSLFDVAHPPFSFRYGGQPLGDLLGAWGLVGDTELLERQRTRHTLTWTDPSTGLQLRRVAVEYADFPAVEWTLYRNCSGMGGGN
jgi:alpha-galactosidase